MIAVFEALFGKINLKVAGYFLLAILGYVLAYKIFHIPSQLELVVIVSSLLFIPILVKPVIGVHALFVILPFVPFIRKLYYLVFQRPAQDPLLVLGDVLIVVTFLGLFFDFKDRRETSPLVSFYMKMIFAYLIYLAVRTVVANELETSTAIFKFKFYGPAVLLFYIGVFFADKSTHLKAIFVTTLILGFIAACYGFKQMYLGYSEAEKLWFSSISFTSLFIKGFARPFSFFQSPAAFAGYLLISIIAAFVINGFSRLKLLPLVVMLIIIYSYGILITSVRSIWIGIVICLFVWMIFLQIKKLKYKLIVTAAIVATYIFLDSLFGGDLKIGRIFNLAAAKIPDAPTVDIFISSRVSAVENPLSEHSFRSRLNLWKYILSTSTKPAYAIAGRGLGAMTADSLYFTYLAEFGYPGLFFIIFIIFSFIAHGLRIIETSNDDKIVLLAKGVVSFNITFAIISISGTHINIFPWDVYFWFWNGVLIKLSGIENEVLKTRISSEAPPPIAVASAPRHRRETENRYNSAVA